MTTRIPVLVIAMLSVAGVVQAQTARDWTRQVRAGKAIFVTTMTGERIDGNAGEVGIETITVLTAGGARVVPMAEIEKVQQHVNPWSRATAGKFAAILIGFAAISSIDFCPQRSDICIHQPPGPRTYVYMTAAFVAGRGIDVIRKKRRTLYEAKAPPRASLVMGRRSVGLAFSF